MSGSLATYAHFRVYINMKTYMNKYLFVLFLMSCTNYTTATKFVLLSPNNTSSKFYCLVVNSTNIIIEANNKKVETYKKVTINYFYDFSTDTAGNKTIEITFDKFFVNLKNNDEEDNYDSEKKDDVSVMMDKILKKIKGSIINVKVDPRGKIIKITGIEEISAKVINSIPNYQDNSNEEIKKQISEFVGQKFITENLVNNLQLIPDTAILVGSTWKNKTADFSQIPINAVVENTLISVKDGVGTITSKAIITTNNLKTLSVMNLNVKADLNGELNSDYKILEKSGFVIKANTKLSLSGNITVSNHDIPITIKMIKNFNAEVVK